MASNMVNKVGGNEWEMHKKGLSPNSITLNTFTTSAHEHNGLDTDREFSSRSSISPLLSANGLNNNTRQITTNSSSSSSCLSTNELNLNSSNPIKLDINLLAKNNFDSSHLTDANYGVGLSESTTLNGGCNLTLNDEWETHKKKHSPSSRNRKSVQININTNHQQQTSPKSSSIVSSTTDISSVSSMSPQINPQMSATYISTSSNNFSNLNGGGNQNTNDLHTNFEVANTNNNKTLNGEESMVEEMSICDDNYCLVNNYNNMPNMDANNINGNGDVSNNDFNPLNQNQNFNADSVIFDSIFSNENEFQSFLDLLEKKSTDNLKKSPKYSEFARKSLYLQFDPIVQSRSISPEKIKRLSLIKDKQQAIRNFLTEIEEEESEQQLMDKPNGYLTQLNDDEKKHEQNTRDNLKLCTNLLAKIDEAENENKSLNTANSINTVSNSKHEARKSLNTEIYSVSEMNVNNTNMRFSLSHEFFQAQKNENGNESHNNDLQDNRFVQQTQSKNASSESIDKMISNIQVSTTRNTFLSSETANVTHNNSFKSESLSNVTSRNSLDHVKTNDTKSNMVETNFTGGLADEAVLDTEGNSSILDFLNTSNGSKFNANQSLNLLPNSKTNKTALEANALKAKMESIKNQNLERKQQSNPASLLASGVNSITNVTTDDDLVYSSTSTGVTNTSGAQNAFGNSTAANNKLIAELNAMKEREKSYLQQLAAIEEENEKFRMVAFEFERIFHNLLKDKDESEVKLKNEILELTKERDHLQEDVIGVERAFDDLHRRFEKLKTKVEEFKKNEETLQKAIEGYKQQLEKEKLKYSTLKKHAEEKLELANNEIEKLRKSTGIELQTVKAELKRAEIKINSLELSVQQKDQENTQLTNLLEDLLKEVKPNNKI